MDQHRKHPAHGVALIDGQPTIVFDTVCAKDRRGWLACDDVHELLKEVWREARAWMVGRYMIMPDHIHYFAGLAGEIEYENWVKYWKSQFTKKLRAGRASQQPGRARLQPGRARLPPSLSVTDALWQTDHWDRRVRSENDYADRWMYVAQNPVRKGLVARSEDWPYQGEIFELPWR